MSQPLEVEKFVKIHKETHMGLKRSLYLAKRLDIKISERDIQQIILNCNECQSIDPSSVKWKSGKLDITQVWVRLAIGVTKFNDVKYLTIIDCGPSRFTLWRHIKDESSLELIKHLRNVFQERGPPTELVVDNYSSFHSDLFRRFVQEWHVNVIYRAVNRPSGNGIIERNHRSIKALASRSKNGIRLFYTTQLLTLQFRDWESIINKNS